MKNATSRNELQDVIAAIPAIKRLFICLTNLRDWKVARSYNTVTCDLLYRNHPMTDEMWKRSDELWAKLYGVNYTPKA